MAKDVVDEQGTTYTSDEFMEILETYTCTKCGKTIHIDDTFVQSGNVVCESCKKL